jgi:hypothetical protein
MSDERRAETEHLIALELDRPSVYMGGPSMASRRKAKAILVILDRLRDARGDDEGKRDIMDVFRSDEAMRAFGVDRSPQDKDHRGPAVRAARPMCRSPGRRRALGDVMAHRRLRSARMGGRVDQQLLP